MKLLACALILHAVSLSAASSLQQMAQILEKGSFTSQCSRKLHSEWVDLIHPCIRVVFFQLCVSHLTVQSIQDPEHTSHANAMCQCLRIWSKVTATVHTPWHICYSMSLWTHYSMLQRCLFFSAVHIKTYLLYVSCTGVFLPQRGRIHKQHIDRFMCVGWLDGWLSCWAIRVKFSISSTRLQVKRTNNVKPRK